MSCISDDFIQKYVDGEASPDELEFIEQHLLSCENCAAKIDDRRKLASSIKAAINSRAEGPIEIPAFESKQNKPPKQIITTRRVIYSIAAACIIIFMLVNTRNKEHKTDDGMPAMPCSDWEYDANKTVSQQDMVIQFVDAKGIVIEYIIE